MTPTTAIIAALLADWPRDTTTTPGPVGWQEWQRRRIARDLAVLAALAKAGQA